jgi:hypothetical protein
MATQEAVDHEVKLLQQQVKLLGKADDDGVISCTFGELFDATEQIFEALGGTLKAAKKRGVVTYKAPLLLKGAHDAEVITLLVPPEE